MRYATREKIHTVNKLTQILVRKPRIRCQIQTQSKWKRNKLYMQIFSKIRKLNSQNQCKTCTAIHFHHLTPDMFIDKNVLIFLNSQTINALLINKSVPFSNHKLKHEINACASSPVCNKNFSCESIFVCVQCVYVENLRFANMLYGAKCARIKFK